MHSRKKSAKVLDRHGIIKEWIFQMKVINLR